MKKLILLLSIVMSVQSVACYISKADLLNCSMAAKKCSKKAECEKSKSDCIEFPSNFICGVFVEIDNIVNGTAIMSHNEDIACAGVDSCTAVISANPCTDVTEDRITEAGSEFTNTYCTKITGYEQINLGKIIVEDATLKTAYDTAQATAKAMEDALQMAKERMAWGHDIIALLIVRNGMKGLDEAQIVQMNTDYANIKGLLETGSLVSARTAILAITADGVITTDADKVALVDKINQYPNL